MFNKKVQKSLSRQMNSEFYGSYLYLSLSSFADRINLPGFANWFRVQSEEEYGHAMRFYEFIIDRDGTPEFAEIKSVKAEYESIQDACRVALRQERKVTQDIDKLYELANENKSYSTQTFLQWFLTEQVEEEKAVRTIVEHLKMIGRDTAALLQIDMQLQNRSLSTDADANADA
ncbi:ferritin [bacterium AH-315-E10]|nr:ferritin [bacterium AH-315-E10]